jgi:hypothetical protein
MSGTTCEICGGPSVGVASSSLGAISHAYCALCASSNREVWTTLIGGLFGTEPDAVADWVKPIIEATCEFYKKTEEQLWLEVAAMEQAYNEHINEEKANE